MGRGRASNKPKKQPVKVQKQEKYEREARKRQAKRDARKAILIHEAEARGETLTDAQAEIMVRAKGPKKGKKDKKNGVDKPTPVAGAEVEVNGKVKKSKKDKKNGIVAPEPTPTPAVDSEWETDASEENGNNDDDLPERPALDLSRLEDSESDISSDEDKDEAVEDKDGEEDSEDDEEEAEDDEDDIPLSDLDSIASEDKGDIIPHQRLTINNTVALTAALKRIQLPYSKLAFSEHQSVTTDEPVDISDIEDDLSRELAFYKQSLSAVKDARNKLKKEGVPFSRPADYFAEMVKSDEHMGKIKQKLIDAAAGKKAAAEARKQRDLKKFGKQVQVAKLQERSKEKRDTMDKINILKRKRQGADITATNEEDLFDVAINKEDSRSSDRQRSDKRQKKDEKFGFGGKKRHAKSNDAKSSADGRDFSSRKMKGKSSGGAGKRPGKSKRAKMH